MSSKRKETRCPVCQFSYAWDGKNCKHCNPPPDEPRKRWEDYDKFYRLMDHRKRYTHRQLAAVAAACLRRAWDLLPVQTRRLVEVLEVGAPIATILQVLRSLSEERSEVTYLTNRVDDWVASANEINWVIVVDTVASISRKLIGIHAFPDRPLSTFPLPPHLELYRGEIEGCVGTRTETTLRTRINRLRGEARAVRETPALVGVEEAFAHTFQLRTEYYQKRNQVERPEEIIQCDIARDVIGYPEAHVNFLNEWKTSTVCAIALGMHESCDYSAMPIMADALQDAGCEDLEVLTHCRSTKPHFRGCWVISYLA